MSNYTITYVFQLIHPQKANQSIEYQVPIDEKTLQYIPPKSPQQLNYPLWTELKFHQCEGCPLKEDDYKYCPVAKNLHELVTHFQNEKSYEKVQMKVLTPERTYLKETDLQTGLFSIFGLIMAASECPQMNFFRPLVKFHLPFANLEETLFRTISMFFLRHYFLGDRTANFNQILDDLKRSYEKVSLVNKGLLERINHVVQADAEKNALVGLNLFVQAFSMEYETNLDSLAYLFDYFRLNEK